MAMLRALGFSRNDVEKMITNKVITPLPVKVNKWAYFSRSQIEQDVIKPLNLR